jgi:omega-6 fatty acid desaturase (delta-12 desaturase)
MDKKEWNVQLKPFARPNHKKAMIQILNTVVIYIALLIFTMYLYQADTSILYIIPLIIVTGLFMIRVFILFHDCTHQSFTSSRKWNERLGYFFGILTFTSYAAWQKDHNIHHGAVGNLDRRGAGDIWTLTIEEYNEKPMLMKAWYRLFRHPMFLFTVAPIFLFTVLQRIPTKHARRREHLGYLITNIGILLQAGLLSYMFGISTYLIIQLSVMFIGGTVGVWMFYVQHQFEEVYWEEASEWNSVDAALKGSTFYQLPAILEWFSGYIGYHHIHHLNSRIPNYHLKKCYYTIQELQEVKTIRFKESLKLALLQIYDQKRKRLISFQELNLRKNYN